MLSDTYVRTLEARTFFTWLTRQNHRQELPKLLLRLRHSYHRQPIHSLSYVPSFGEESMSSKTSEAEMR
jgi:hypothetical protein